MPFIGAMSRPFDLDRLSLYAALAGVASLVVADLLGGGGFSLGLSHLFRGIVGEGLLGRAYEGGEAGGVLPLACFALALLLAVAAYVRAAAGVAAGTRLAAAITRRPGDPAPGLADRLRRARTILLERRGAPAPARTSAAIDALLVPIAGEGVTVSRPEPLEPRPAAAMPWRARAGQRTTSEGNSDRWSIPGRDEEDGQ
jgi:hypothetical protein